MYWRRKNCDQEVAQYCLFQSDLLLWGSNIPFSNVETWNKLVFVDYQTEGYFATKADI